MDFKAGNIYHIYNRGNDKQRIFFTEANYLYFLKKVRKYMLPHCEIIAYVLMPNHFHFLVYADERTEMECANGTLIQNVLSNGIRLLLSSYTKGVNKQENRTGNLIQQNTKSKCVFDQDDIPEENYAEVCFYYIHNNPLSAKLVQRMEDWEYSSYRDHAGLRNGTLCNKKLFPDVFNVLNSSNCLLDEDTVRKIF